ncbi:MAG: hypothetical protein WCX60_01405 [Anaerovoracaceae bacterium]
MKLTTLNVIVYLMSIFSGCFFFVMILTFLENKYQKFREFTEKIHGRIPQSGWRVLSLLTFLTAGVLVALFTTLGVTRGGILVGSLGGIIIHFKAGVSTESYNEANYEQPRRSRKKLKTRGYD